MAIKDLEVRQGDVDIVLDIIELGEVREFTKFGKTGRVASAKAKDETGEINISLWNEQIDQVKAGQKVHITNGYVNEFQGEKQLTTGKFGKLEIVGEASTEEAAAEEPKAAEETVAEEKPTEEAPVAEKSDETAPEEEPKINEESVE